MSSEAVLSPIFFNCANISFFVRAAILHHFHKNALNGESLSMRDFNGFFLISTCCETVTCPADKYKTDICLHKTGRMSSIIILIYNMLNYSHKLSACPGEKKRFLKIARNIL